MRRRFELTHRAASSLDELLDALEAFVSAETENETLAGEIRLIGEEALTNVLEYAYEEAEAPATLAEVQATVGRDRIVIEFHDRGRPFDPSRAPSPDLDAPLDDRPEGGLGIHLIRSYADELRYRREGETNILIVEKRLDRPSRRV